MILIRTVIWFFAWAILIDKIGFIATACVSALIYIETSETKKAP